MVLVAMALLCAGAAAQSSCTSVLVNLSPCLNYITGNSSTPSSGCCSQLASVVSSQPQCLCQVLNGGGSSLGININQTQALALPSSCNVQTPPTTQCNNGKITKFLLTCKFYHFKMIFPVILKHIRQIKIHSSSSNQCMDSEKYIWKLEKNLASLT